MFSFSMLKGVAAVGSIFVIFCAIGLATNHALKGHTPTAEEKAIVAKYDALPESAKAALMAKNMVGLTVFQKTPDQPICSQVFEVFLRNGARRASSEKAADLIISGKSGGNYGSTTITVKDKFGNFFLNDCGVTNGLNFATDLADTLGSETKVDIIQRQHRQTVIDSHKKVLGLK